MSVRAVAVKEVKSALREKTLLLMFLIQLFIAAFIGFLVVGVFSYFSPEALGDRYLSEANVAIVTHDPNHELVGYVAQSQGIRVFIASEFPEAMKAFYEGRVDGVLVVPEEKAEGKKPIKVDLYLPKTELEATVLAAALKKPLQRYEASVRKIRAQRLSPEFREVLSFDPRLPEPKRASSYYEFVYGILIPLLLIAPALVSGGLIIDLLTEEIEKKTLLMLLSSPLSLGRVLDGKVLVAVSISPFQTLLWMYILGFNGIETLNKIAVLIFTAGISLLMVSWGAIISLHYEKRGTAHFVYSLVLLNLFFASLALPWISPLGVITTLTLGILHVQGFLLFLTYSSAALLSYFTLKRWFVGKELKTL